MRNEMRTMVWWNGTHIKCVYWISVVCVTLGYHLATVKCRMACANTLSLLSNSNGSPTEFVYKSRGIELWQCALRISWRCVIRCYEIFKVTVRFRTLNKLCELARKLARLQSLYIRICGFCCLKFCLAFDTKSCTSISPTTHLTIEWNTSVTSQRTLLILS